jgi:hypothetical protein
MFTVLYIFCFAGNYWSNENRHVEFGTETAKTFFGGHAWMLLVQTRWTHQNLCFCLPCTKQWKNILTYSMEQSPSWEANWSAASQQIPRILWNPKVHHRTHKRTPPVPILSQLHPVHTPTSHFPKIHSNIILPPMPGSRQWCPSLRPPHQKPIHISPLPRMRYMPCPSHSSWFYHLHNIGWGVQIIQLLIT